jgi:inner membrane protein
LAGIACVALVCLKKRALPRKTWWRMGLGLSGLYLIYCLINKTKIDSDVKDILEKQKISYTRYFTTPAPLQNWLWYVVANTDSGYYTGFRSLFDSRKEIDFQYFPRNDSLLNPVESHKDLQKLLRFSQQWYTVESWGDTLVFNDLRFGQVIGWQIQRKIRFSLLPAVPGRYALVVQRGQV